MADNLIQEPSSSAISLTGYQRIINKLTKQSKGLAAVDLDNYSDGSTAPSVVAGGVYELNGSYFEVTSNTQITGMTNSSTVYYIYSNAGTWTASTGAPEWSNSKHGWYNPSNANSRCFFKITTDSGGEYDQRKRIDPPVYGVGLRFEYLTSGSGNWTVPAGVYQVKVTAIGGGGGGGGGWTSTGTGGHGSNGGDTTFGTITASGGHGGYSADYTNSFAGIDLTGGVSGNGGMPGIQSGPRTGTKGNGGQIVIQAYSVTPGDTVSYSVGAGGTGGNATTDGGDGGDGSLLIEW